MDPNRLVELVARLTRDGTTVATAESLTGGLLCALLTEVPGASSVVRGGLVSYATELKHELVGVDADLLERRGAVDPEVARQMARGARQRCGARLGVGLTGVAGPARQDGKDVGTVFVALSGSAVPDGDGGDSRDAVDQVVELHAGDDGATPGRATVQAEALEAAVRLLEDYVATSGRADGH
ncbi:CinA family protein [Nakamurella endophytica]